jgi:hypothetical protein
MASFSSLSTVRVVGRTMDGTTRPDRAASALTSTLRRWAATTRDSENTQIPACFPHRGANKIRCPDAAVLFERVFACLSRGGAASGLRCAGASIAVIYVFRRRRLTFASVRLTNGANSAAWPRPLMSAPIDIWSAAAFSAVMRRYSAGVQVPWAIIRLRRKTVSQDAIVRRAIIIGRAEDEFRAGFLMSWK